MKKFLLGFAFIASLAMMFTSCPGPKPKDSVSGKFDDLVCGKTYDKNSGKELTINLETDQFKNAMTVDYKADGISIKFKSSAAAADAEPENYSDKFLVKTGTSANDKSVTLYFVGGPYEVETSGELSIEIAADALVERSKATDAEALSLGSIAFKVSPNIVFSNDQIVYSYVEGKKAAGAEGDATVLSLVPMAIHGALFKVDPNGIATKTLTLDGSEKDYVDISNWFVGLPNGVNAVRRKIEVPEGQTTDTYKGAPSINVRFVVLEANKTVASTSAAKVFANVPAGALTISSAVKSSNNLTFFITKDPNATEASKKPKLTISDGTLTGKVGESINEVEFTLTIDGDCCSVAMGEAERDASKAGLLNFIKVKEGDKEPVGLNDYSDFIVAEISEDVEIGATSFKVKLSAKKDGDKTAVINKPAIEGILKATVDGFFCNTYKAGLVSEDNTNAKLVITDDRSFAINPAAISLTADHKTSGLEVTITLTGDTFKDAFTTETDIRTWFDAQARAKINTAKAKTAVEAGQAAVTVMVIPDGETALDETDVDITIPAAKLTKGVDLKKSIKFSAAAIS